MVWLRERGLALRLKMSGWSAAAYLAVMLCAVASDLSVAVVGAPGPGGRELKYEEPKYLAGTILTPDSKQVLFKFKRVASRAGSRLEVHRDFTYPDGRPAAREEAIYEGDSLVSFELEELQIGAAGTVRIRRDEKDGAKGSVEFEYSKELGDKPKVRSEALREDTLIADMVAPFLKSHWDELTRGEEVKCRCIIVPRRETVGFTFTKGAALTWQGREVLTVRMEASSAIIARLVSPLVFTIEKAPPHRVLQYAGRTTPKIQAGGKWKDLDAVTVFNWESAR